ncbi:MAG: virulence RhuM family protein, partial [Dysgonamonadaceae bacterium]|nr:virulence RhuM family protein [Dysgonamonadaceae bacterium]
VVIFLETAELQAKGRKDLTMKFWRENVDGIITFNRKNLLVGVGAVSNAQMEKHANEVYEQFNRQRKQYDLEQADKQDLEELKMLEDEIKSRHR